MNRVRKDFPDHELNIFFILNAQPLEKRRIEQDGGTGAGTGAGQHLWSECLPFVPLLPEAACP
jgi:hypothetical protein